MRFSLFLVACTLLSSAVAIPGGRKPGTNSKPKDPNREIPAANPGDVVLVKSHDMIDAKINGLGSSQRRIHPAVVIEHDHENGIVHVAPIGHDHPDGVPTVPGAPLGIPDNNGASLVAVGTPKEIKHEEIHKLGEPRKGSAPFPERLTDENFNALKGHIAANQPGPSAQEPPAGEKGKGKGKGKAADQGGPSTQGNEEGKGKGKGKGKEKEKEKRSFERRRVEARRRVYDW